MHSSCETLQDLPRFRFLCKIDIFLARFFQEYWKVFPPITFYKILAKLLLTQDVLQEILASSQILQVLAMNKF